MQWVFDLDPDASGGRRKHKKIIFQPTNITPLNQNQVVIAQWLAWQPATGEVPGSNPGKGKNLL